MAEFDAKTGALIATDPVRVEVIVKAQTGEPLFKVEAEGLINPGETVAWTYPEGGIRIVCD
jgi:hypothetical protein